MFKIKNDMNNNDKQTIVSIGLPIYNGEKFLKKRIENLLLQTFSNFELIISDNASTDRSVQICKEFMKKDSRIKIYQQEKNIGQFQNYNFVLNESQGRYFLWVAADDLLEPTFLEKNVEILDSNDNVVTSVSKLKMFGSFTDGLRQKENSLIKRIESKIKARMSYMSCFPVSGKYENRVTKFLKTARHSQVFYGIHRTDALKKCIIDKPIMGQDTVYALSLLKYGNIHVIDDILMSVFDGGTSREGDMFKMTKLIYDNVFWVIFPWIHFTLKCKKLIGWKLFLRNFTFFIKYNALGWLSLLLTIKRKL